MSTLKLLTVSLSFAAMAAIGIAAEQSTSVPYEQKIDAIYGESDGVGLLMDIFTPKGKANGLGIIDIASGSFYSDRGKIRDHTAAQVYSIFCGRGYTVFAVRPGSRTRFSGVDMAAHVKLAIRYVKQHAADFKIDPERLGITGGSAGGHLATLVAVTPESGKPEASSPGLRQSTQLKAAAVFFPPTDFLDWGGKTANFGVLGDLLFPGGIKGHSEDELKERATEISPARQVKSNPIPFLIIHGDADPIVPLQQSQKMVEVLKAAGGSAELIVKKGGGHPWMTIAEEVKVMADWFDQQLPETKSGASAAGNNSK